jgi:HK97 gp10 family phage protein
MARIIGVPRQLGPRGSVGSRVRIIGIPEAKIKLGLVSKVARLELGLLAAGAANRMMTLAKFYCPEITGNLKSSIKLLKLGSYTYQITAASREGNNPEKNNKEYAGFVEFGTSKMAPRFFMRQAYQETVPVVIADLNFIARKLERL